MLWVERGIRPKDLLDPDLPVEITDALEEYLDELATQPAGRGLPGSSSRRLTDDEMIALVKAAEMS